MKPRILNPKERGIGRDTYSPRWLQKEREAFLNLANKLSIQKMDQWLQVDFTKHDGIKDISSKFGSLTKALDFAFPEGRWPLSSRSVKYPKIQIAQRETLQNYAKEVGIVKQEDWYHLNLSTITHKPMRKIFRYHHSAWKALEKLYPEFEWYPWLFHGSAPVRYWLVMENQRKYFDWVADSLGIHTQSEWYDVKVANIHEKIGGGILWYYGGSVIKALTEVYREFVWVPWLFKFSAHRMFKEISSRRKYLDWLAEELRIERHDEWYETDASEIGPMLTQYYNDSMYEALKSIYPEFKWYGWMFQRTPANYWSKLENQRDYFDWLGEQLGIRNFEEWYDVATAELEDTARYMIHDYHQHSLAKCLSSVYPEHEWLFWRFQKVPRHYWDNEQNVLAYIRWFSEKFHINCLDDWEKVSNEQLHLTAGSLLVKYGSIPNILAKAFPERKWTVNASTDKAQIHLLRTVSKIFQSEPLMDASQLMDSPPLEQPL